MKILFVNPPDSSWVGEKEFMAFEPLALELLAASVEEEHEVRILDMMNIHGSLRHELTSFDPDVLCIGSYTTQVYEVQRQFKEAKKLKPDIINITGGYHPTFLPQDFALPEVDLIVNGPAIPTLQEVLRAYETKAKLSEVAGISLPVNGEFRPTTERVLLPNLDDEPFPARHLTQRYRKYYHILGRLMATIRTSEGCPNRCTFCSSWRFYQGQNRFRSPQLVVEELGRIDEQLIFILDDTFMTLPDRIQALYEAVRASGIQKHFWCFGSSEFIVNYPDLVAKWTEIGLTNVMLGMESVDDEELAKFNKQSNLATNTRAVEILQDYGITPNLSFIVNPEFSKADFERMFQYVKRLGVQKHGYVEYGSLTPIPGSELWDELQDQLLTLDYRLFDFVFPVMATKLPVKKYFRQFLKLYLKTYLGGIGNLSFNKDSQLKKIRSPLEMPYKLPLGKTIRNFLGMMKSLFRLLMLAILGYKGVRAEFIHALPKQREND